MSRWTLPRRRTPPGRAAARLAAGLFAAALAAGCGSAGLRPAGDVEAEVRELRQRIVEMQRQAAVNQMAIDELRAQVASLEAALGVRRSSAVPSSPSRPPGRVREGCDQLDFRPPTPGPPA